MPVALAVFSALLLALTLHMANPPHLLAQDSPGAQIVPGDTIQEVTLTDGSVLFGHILEVTDDHVTLETPGGVRMELERAHVRSVRPARGQVVEGRFWRADPNRSRLFFAPTARPLERGDAYVASYMLFFPFAGYGLTDRLSIAGGTPIFPEIIGEVFYVAPKFTAVKQPGIDLAVGALAFFLTREVDEGSVGVIYGSGTFGSPDRAFSGGVGWGFSLGGGVSRIESDPVFMAGGEIRTGERIKLVTENWFASGEGIATGGVRFFGERLSADLGLGLWRGGGDLECCLPVVNFVYNFGRRG